MKLNQFPELLNIFLLTVICAIAIITIGVLLFQTNQQTAISMIVFGIVILILTPVCFYITVITQKVIEKNKKLNFSMLPKVEKPLSSSYHYIPDKTSYAEITSLLKSKGVFISKNTFVGNWNTNKDNSISLYLDGDIIIKSLQQKKKGVNKSET